MADITPQQLAEAGVEPASLKSYEWKFINGRLLRRSRTIPHERAVSARMDSVARDMSVARDILPRLANEPGTPPRRRFAMYAEAEPRVVWTGSPSPAQESFVGPSQQPRDPMSPRGAATRASDTAINWSNGQLHLISSASVPPSPKRQLDAEDARNPVGARNPMVSEAVGREQKTFSRPSNRSEAIQLAENLDRKLQDAQRDFLATQRSWQITFCEVVRQVYVHCTERGELLDRVRRWYELEFKRLNATLEKARERERKLQEMVRASDGVTMAELDSSIAVSSQVIRMRTCQVVLQSTCSNQRMTISELRPRVSSRFSPSAP